MNTAAPCLATCLIFDPRTAARLHSSLHSCLQAPLASRAAAVEGNQVCNVCPRFGIELHTGRTPIFDSEMYLLVARTVWGSVRGCACKGPKCRQCSQAPSLHVSASSLKQAFCCNWLWLPKVLFRGSQPRRAPMLSGLPAFKILKSESNTSRKICLTPEKQGQLM